MAREFAQISTTIWDSRKVRSLDDDGSRLLYFWLHTNALRNNVGCYVLKFGAAMDDLKWTESKLTKGLDTLREASLVGFDTDERLVRITGFLRQFPTSNENHAKGCVRTAMALPDCAEKLLLLKEMVEDFNCRNVFGVREGIETLSGRYANTDTDTNTDTKTKNPPVGPPGGGDAHEGEGEGSKGKAQEALRPKGFDAWYLGEGIEGYDGYPHKVGVDAAVRAWEKRRKAGTLPTVETLVEGTKIYIATKPETREWCNPATWLNQGRWMDKIEAKTPAAGAATVEAPPSLTGWRKAAFLGEGPTIYRSWVEPAKCSKNADGDTVTAVYPTRFLVDWVRTHYAEKLLRYMRGEDPKIKVVKIELAEAPKAAGEGAQAEQAA